MQAKAKPVVTEPVVATPVKPTTSKRPRGRPPSKKPKAKKPKAATKDKLTPQERAGAWIHETVTKAELSMLLHVSIRGLADLDNRGILVRAAKKGTYQTLPTMKSYISQLQERAAGRYKANENPATQEKHIRDRIEREISELKLAQMRGEIITLAEASEAWSGFATKVKASMMSISSKARSKIPHLTAFDAETIKDICRDELTDLAEEVRAAVPSGDADAIAE